MSFWNFFKEGTPESMSRLILFVIAFCIFFVVIYSKISGSEIDYTGLGVLLGAAFAGKVTNKFKEK